MLQIIKRLTRAGRLERLYSELAQLDLSDHRKDDDLDAADVARLIVRSELSPEAKRHLLETHEADLWALVRLNRLCTELCRLDLPPCQEPVWIEECGLHTFFVDTEEAIDIARAILYGHLNPRARYTLLRRHEQALQFLVQSNLVPQKHE